MQSIRYKIILLFVSSLLLFSGLDQIDVNIMEARNFISAREMVQNNEYLLTTLNNQPRYEKPPLPTWLTAVSGSVFGFDSLFALRVPVVAITILLVFAFYYYSKTLRLDSKHALHNGLILITSFYIFFAGRDNQWDMYTHSFMMVSVLFLWKLFQEDSNQWRNSLLAGLFLGFSILSKGPVSFYAMLIPFLISYGIVYHIPLRKKWRHLVVMLFLGLVVGASWYVYVRMKDPESFGVIASREAANWTTYEVKPFYYYWSFFLQSGLWAIPSLISLLYPYMKSRVGDLKAYRFAIIWTLNALVFLSAIPEKKVRYLVPVLIPLALTTGFYIEYLIRGFSESMAQREKMGVYISSALIALVGLAFPFAVYFLIKGVLTEYSFLYIFSSVAMYVLSFAIIRGLVRKEFASVFYSMIGVFVVVVVAIVPMSKTYFYNPDYASASKARIIGEQLNLKTYGLSAVAPEIVWDFGGSIPIIENKAGQICMPIEKQFGLMADQQDSLVLRTQFAQYDIRKIYRINLYYKKSAKERLLKDFYLLSKNTE